MNTDEKQKQIVFIRSHLCASVPHPWLMFFSEFNCAGNLRRQWH